MLDFLSYARCQDTNSESSGGRAQRCCRWFRASRDYDDDESVLLGKPGNVFDDARIDFRADVGAVTGNDAKSADQFLFGLGFQEIRMSTGAKCAANEFGGIVKGEQHDFDVGQIAMNGTGGFNAVHFGHGDIHDDEVGLEFNGHTDGVDAIFRFADEFPFTGGVEYGLDATTDKGVIIDDQDPGHRPQSARLV